MIYLFAATLDCRTGSILSTAPEGHDLPRQSSRQLVCQAEHYDIESGGQSKQQSEL
jgi:hypothetical protein